MPKLYTPAEADALLPEITPRLEMIREQSDKLASIVAYLQSIGEHARGNGHESRAEELVGEAAVADHALRAALTWLQEHDIELKDPEIGLIDFFHERDGHLVYLCWKLGERSVGYWHEVDAGYAGRRALTSE